MMRRFALAVVAATTFACTSDNAPQRDCLARVWVHPNQGDVRIIGDWNDWARPGIVPEALSPEAPAAGWKLARFELPKGEHGYLLDAGSETLRDPQQPLTTFDLDRDDREVSLLLIDDCSQPRLSMQSVFATDGALTVRAQFLANHNAAPLASVSATTDSGERLSVDLLDPSTGDVILGRTMRRPRETITVVAEDTEGNVTNTRIATWDGARDPRDEVIYQVMIDRFAGDGGVPLAPPPHPGARAGGTLDGIHASLDGIASLGATALWLSPVYQGPEGERVGNDGEFYTGYHGYWPIDTRAVDTRIGGENALEALIEGAHDARLLVLADVVPNHVYETHPRFVEPNNADWFHPDDCVCGTESCPWNEHIQDCWFTPYLPDMRLEHPEALRASVDDVAWMMDRFDLDGLRIDAVPMMPRAASRRIAHRLRRNAAPEQGPLLLGEIFTGPGQGGLEQLKQHLGPAGMNSVFDFPLMWAMHDAIATGRGGFDGVEAILQAEELVLAGSGAVLARILDNHDTPRFVSVANGDGYGNPWSAPATQPTQAEPYLRLQLGLALIFTLPGMPVLFQGDEIGLAGANDPDCRRVMPREDELNPHQLAVRETVEALGRIRANSVALRRGDRSLIQATRSSYLFERRHEDTVVIVAISSSTTTQTVETTRAGVFQDAMTGDSIDVRSFAMAPLSFRILVPPTAVQP